MRAAPGVSLGTLYQDQIEQLRLGDGARHEDRVGRLTCALALALELDADKAGLLGAAAVLHDVGKAAIPAKILCKPAPLDAEERLVMQTHSRLGHAVLADNRDGFLALAAAIALSHHEAFDGSGYPAGLRGDAIPLEGRIVALADVYAALREPRPYREPIPHEAAASIILTGDDRTRPSNFDPAILEAFRRTEHAFDLIISGDPQ
jgi:HD-GYP domain-containing protein (c-di-GMP phosphodiesterase class II)